MSTHTHTRPPSNTPPVDVGPKLMSITPDGDVWTLRTYVGRKKIDTIVVQVEPDAESDTIKQQLDVIRQAGKVE